MEWPPRFGKTATFTEIDCANFFTVSTAREKMHPAEFEFLLRLQQILSEQSPSSK
jgi:predicted NUDIX family NTP pyrophosphohydrolase